MDPIDRLVEAEFSRHRDNWYAEDNLGRYENRVVNMVPRPVSQVGSAGIPGARRGTIPLVTGAEIVQHMSRAKAPTTNRNMAYTIRNYTEMCIASAIVAFPVSGVSLVTYVVGLTKKALKYETVADYVSTIKVESRSLSNVELSQMEKEQLRLVLQSAKRILGSRPTKRTVTLDINQVHLLAHMIPSSGRNRSTVAYLIGTMGLLRLKEVVSLKFNDITFSSTGDYVSVHIRQSKTDQSGVGAYVFIGCVSIPNHQNCDNHVCAMHRLQVMLDSLSMSERTGSLFGATYAQLRSDINYLVTTVFSGTLEDGMEVGKETSHSMRRTGVRLLADANVRLEAIADYGRWKDVRTVQNNYMRDHSGRLGREKSYCSRMLHEG